MARRSDILFCIAFALMLVLPLAATSWAQNGDVSESENRTFALAPRLVTDSGTLNHNVTGDFDRWFSDSVGFRSEMVKANALIDYCVFKRLPEGYFRLGPNGEFNYTPHWVVSDYSHLNLPDEASLMGIVSSYSAISNWLETQDVQCYFMQCRDKQTIYPEQFPASVNQYGDVSRVDMIVDAVKAEGVAFVDVKEALLVQKDVHDVFGRFYEPTHWTPRGAYFGYLELMGAINRRNGGAFKTLDESDYDLSFTDQGTTLYQCIHEVDMQEKFEIFEPSAVPSENGPAVTSGDRRGDLFYVNPQVDNDARILVLGDSYFFYYIADDIAESFRETVFLWNTGGLSRLPEYVREYEPDIVVIEAVERVDKTDAIIELGEAIVSHNVDSAENAA